ncbi:MAG: hypothetical protein RJA20_1344 [Bacteroidota bacterium]|jgi:hypothetical protein
MKKLLLLILFFVAGLQMAQAQIPDGSIAPDFTGVDINGESHNLYDLLNAGKHVYIDVSATWCGPCWNYHNSHAFRDLWETHGPPGTDEAFVMFIEGDGATNTACLYGPSGCVGGTQGDWVSGTPYPIIDDASIAGLYQIAYYPTIFYICPYDKKVYEAGQLPATSLWNFRTSHCAPPPITYSIDLQRNVKCYGTNSGAINITPGGGLSGNFTYLWSNGATTQDLNNIPAGTYTVTITRGAQSTVSDPFEILQPAQPLTSEVVSFIQVGCNGLTGSITATGIGGWDSNYSYSWSNGGGTETAIGLNAGTYTCTVTDAEGCTSTVSQTLAAPTYPTATVANPPSIDCAHPTIQLDGTQSSTGDDFSYLWFATSGGHIVSGGTTLTPTVDSAGSYTLRVTNINTTCASFATRTVNINITHPDANAGSNGVVSCPIPQDTLSGSGSTGTSFSYAWNGPNVVSGGNTLSPVVGAPGVYTLVVTNSSNGCTTTSTTTVTGNNVPPSVSTTGSEITCVIDTVNVTASTNSGNATFAWTGPDGFTSNLQSPVVTVPGSYSVIVSDTLTGCNNNGAATVANNTSGPGAGATGGFISCLVGSTTVTGTTSDTTATYAWTGPNGFTSNLSSFSTQAPGTYALAVTSPANGCVSTATAVVDDNTAAPGASCSSPGNFNCNTTQITLSGTGSSEGPDMAYAWSTSDGRLVSGENTLSPVIDAAGTYQILVTNTASGCTNTATVTVIQRPNVSASLTSQNNVSCNGGSNGAAAVEAAGGNSVFSYNWSNGSSDAAISNLAAGEYTVTVTDGENCTAVTTAVISEPTAVFANASATSQIQSGINDGTATADPTGGVAPYTYLWSNGETSQSVSGLAPGTYVVSVTDANGCAVSQSVTVNSVDCAISATSQSSDVTCPGGSDGAASVTVTGGLEPLSYVWNNGGTGSALSNLTAGNYSVTVTDDAGCIAQSNITIGTTDPEAPVVTAENAIVVLDQSGSASISPATVNAQGSDNCGVAGITVSPSSFDCTNLGEHEVVVTVTDVSGLTSSATVTVKVVDTEAPVVTCPDNVVVCSYNNVVSYQPANAQDNCLILNGQWQQTSGLPSGSEFPVGTTEQRFTFTDASGNSGSCSFTVTVTPPVNVTSVTIVNEFNGQSNGSIDITVEGGVAPLSFHWTANGQDLADTEDVSGLAAGSYSVEITDANGCVFKRENFEVTNSSATHEPVWMSGISLLPNPTDGITRIVFGEIPESRMEVSLIDGTGRVLRNLYLEQANMLTVDCSELPAGLYTVRFRANNEIGARKLSVVK